MKNRLVIARGSGQRWGEHGKGREESVAIKGSMRDAWGDGNVRYLVHQYHGSDIVVGFAKCYHWERLG